VSGDKSGLLVENRLSPTPLVFAAIHALAVFSVVHLAWVSFYQKTPTNPFPNDVYITVVLFSITYLSVFFIWVTSIPFLSSVPSNTNVVELINGLLYRSIGYVSPFKASEYTGITKLFSETQIYQVIRNHYYNDVMVVLAILFFYGLTKILIWPESAMSSFAVLNSELGFFLTMLLIFYGTGSVSIVLLLRFLCLVINLHRKSVAIHNKGDLK